MTVTTTTTPALAPDPDSVREWSRLRSSAFARLAELDARGGTRDEEEEDERRGLRAFVGMTLAKWLVATGRAGS